VHAAQRIEVFALPRLGSTLTVRGRAAAKWVQRTPLRRVETGDDRRRRVRIATA
jgi:hypothetical protein